MRIFTILFTTILPVLAGPMVNIDQLGTHLGGWTAKGERAADYERSGSKYRTWKPEVTPMLDGGIFISLRIDHIRGMFSSDDHASLQVTLDKEGNIIQASSSMAFQGKKITSDVIRLGTGAGTSLVPLEKAAKVGTNLVADLTSKLLRENIAEPGRVTFPAVIHHNYNILCLATGLVDEKQIGEPEPVQEENQPAETNRENEQTNDEQIQKPLKINTKKEDQKNTGNQPVTLPVPAQ